MEDSIDKTAYDNTAFYPDCCQITMYSTFGFPISIRNNQVIFSRTAYPLPNPHIHTVFTDYNRLHYGLRIELRIADSVPHHIKRRI